MTAESNAHTRIDYTSSDLRIGADHPCLAGHFPGNPVVPAVVGLQTVTDVLQAQMPHWRVTGIRQAKFMSPLLPEQDFVIRLQGVLPSIEFQCHAGERLVAKGSLDVAMAESAAE